MRFLTILTVSAVLAVALMSLPSAVEAEAEAEAGAEALPEPVLSENSELKKPKPKPTGTTTMSPKDLFLKHAQISTTKKGFNNRKKGSSRATTTAATAATTTTTTTTTTATVRNTASVATTAKPKNKPNAKPKPKAKGKAKGQGQGQDKGCKTNQKGNRKSRANCQHSHHNKTVTTHMDTAINETVTPINPADPIATPTVDKPEQDDTLTTAALIMDRSDDVSQEMAANEPQPSVVAFDNPNATTTVLANGTLKEVKTKADLIALDSINGTNDERNVFP
ncbi:hypothetical protein ACLKA6_010273 [Drosophila palustris]